jgi:hypothetical protein
MHFCKAAKLMYKLGGNEAFKTFMESYGPEGGYRKGMDMQEKYNCWAATQYREKVGFRYLAPLVKADRVASGSLCQPAIRLVSIGSSTCL